MSKRLSNEQIEQFETLGYVSPVRLFSARQCRDFDERIRAFQRERPDDVAWAFDIKANLLFDWVYRLSADPRTLDAVEDLLGPNLYNTDTVFRIKEPGSGTHYGWHQDAARIRVDPCFIIVYLAISESTCANGGLRVIPGSHRAALPFQLVENPDGQAQRKVPRTAAVDESRAVDLSLGPGEATFFSGLLVHGSGPNRSNRRRVAILTDYTAAHARQSRGRGSGQLLRGTDRWGYIAEEPVPAGSCAREDVVKRRDILTRFPENPLMGPLAPGQRPRFPDAPG